MSGLISLLILVADIWALVKVIQSKAETGTKILWVVLIVFLPIIGLALWWFMGPKK